MSKEHIYLTPRKRSDRFIFKLSKLGDASEEEMQRFTICVFLLQSVVLDYAKNVFIVKWFDNKPIQMLQVGFCTKKEKSLDFDICDGLKKGDNSQSSSFSIVLWKFCLIPKRFHMVLHRLEQAAWASTYSYSGQFMHHYKIWSEQNSCQS